MALANKMARIAWKLMVTGQSYATKSAPRLLGMRGLEISQTRGADSTVTVLSRCQNLQDNQQMA